MRKPKLAFNFELNLVCPFPFCIKLTCEISRFDCGNLAHPPPMEQHQPQLLALLRQLERQCYLLQMTYSAIYLMDDVTDSSEPLNDAATNRALSNATAVFRHFSWRTNEEIIRIRNEIQQLGTQTDDDRWRY